MSRVGVDVYGTSYGGVDIVDARTESTLSVKNVAKSSAVWSQESSLTESQREASSGLSAIAELLVSNVIITCHSLALGEVFVMDARLA